MTKWTEEDDRKWRDAIWQKGSPSRENVKKFYDEIKSLPDPKTTAVVGPEGNVDDINSYRFARMTLMSMANKSKYCPNVLSYYTDNAGLILIRDALKAKLKPEILEKLNVISSHILVGVANGQEKHLTQEAS